MIFFGDNLSTKCIKTHILEYYKIVFLTVDIQNIKEQSMYMFNVLNRILIYSYSFFYDSDNVYLM